MASFNPQNADKELESAFVQKAVSPAAPREITPVAPDVDRNSAAYLQSIIQNVGDTQRTVARRQATRADQLNTVTADAMKEINEADNNLATKTDSFFARLIEDFNPDYNPKTQMLRKQSAMHTIKTQTAMTKAHNAADKLEIEAAKQPLEMLKLVQSIRKGQVDMKVSEMQLIINNQAVQKGLRKSEQTTVTIAEAKQRATTGDYSLAVPESFVIDKLLNYQKLLDDVEASEDARKMGKLALADRQLESAMLRLPLADGKTILQGAKEFGLTSLDLGGGLSLPIHRVKQRVAELETQEFEREKALAGRMAEIEKYATRDTAVVNNAISTAVTTPAGGQAATLPTATELMNMSEVELTQQNLFNQLPVDVATATYDLVQAKLRLDEQMLTGKAETKNLLAYNQKVADLQKVTEQRNKDFVEGVAKKHQPAFRKLVDDGMIVSDPNQGAQILLETGVDMPNLHGNSALGSGFRQFVIQLGEQLGMAGKDSFFDEEGDANAIYETLVAKLTFGATLKTTDFIEVSKAINKLPENGQTVKKTIVNEQTSLVFEQAIRALSEEYPDIQKHFFTASNTKSDKWFNENEQASESRVIQELINLGIRRQEEEPSFYYAPLREAVFKVMQAQAPSMENFTSVNAQAFMKLVFPFEDMYTTVNRDLTNGIDSEMSVRLQAAEEQMQRWKATQQQQQTLLQEMNPPGVSQ